MGILCLAAFAPLRSSAQAVWAQGGTSTLMSASGAQLDYRWAPVQGWLGVGFSDTALIGGYLETKFRTFDVGLGDRYQPLSLESDVFDGSRYFSGRGVFVTRKGEHDQWTAFAGATASERAYEFFRAFDIQQSTAALFYSRKFSKLRYSSFNIVQDKATSIHSVQFPLLANLLLSAGVGVGYNSPFATAGAKFDSRRLQVTAGYISAGTSFRRIGGVTTNAPEHVGTNIRLRFQPVRRFAFSLAHENLFTPTRHPAEDALRVSLNSGSVFTTLRGFNLSASATRSSSGTLHSQTQNFGVSREITNSISASGNVMRLMLSNGTSSVYGGSVREKISPRLSLNQGVTRQGNTSAFTFGGRFLSNRVTVGIQHDLLFSTLAGGFAGKSYIRMWSVNLKAHLFGGVSIHADSLIDPLGRVRYTGWVDGIGFGKAEDRIAGGPTQPNPSFSKFIVKGVVQDTEGKPVWGISVQVDGQNAFSDSTGRFFLRFRRGERYPVSIVPERSLNMQYYEVTEAPVSALAEPEDVAQPIIIIVRKAQMPPPRRRSEIDTSDPAVGSGGLAPDAAFPGSASTDGPSIVPDLDIEHPVIIPFL